MRSEERKRIPFWDVARFVAMLMVVFWHFIYCSPTFDKSTVSCVANFIVGMNMPLFFVIAGYFAREMLVMGRHKKLVGRIVMCVWPVLIFSLIRTLLGVCHAECTIPWLFQRFVKYVLFDHWFINCLIVCQCITFAIFFFARGRKLLGAIGFFIAFVGLWLYPGGLWYSLAMIPFYWQ